MQPLILLGIVKYLSSSPHIVLFLRSGFKAFRNGEKQKSQVLMRGRVAAQFFTIAAMGVGAYFGMKPHDRPATMEEKMQRMEPKN